MAAFAETRKGFSSTGRQMAADTEPGNLTAVLSQSGVCCYHSVTDMAETSVQRVHSVALTVEHTSVQMQQRWKMDLRLLRRETMLAADMLKDEWRTMHCYCFPVQDTPQNSTEYTIKDKDHV